MICWLRSANSQDKTVYDAEFNRPLGAFVILYYDGTDSIGYTHHWSAGLSNNDAMDMWWLRSCKKPMSTGNPLIDNNWHFCDILNGNADYMPAYEYDNSWQGYWTKDGDSKFGDEVLVKICRSKGRNVVWK